MAGYLLRRVLATIPVMGIVALFVFSLLYLAPGDPAAIIAGDQATPADVERIRAGLGLDRPFLIRFGEWSWNVLRGDLGVSIFTNLPVTRMIQSSWALSTLRKCGTPLRRTRSKREPDLASDVRTSTRSVAPATSSSADSATQGSITAPLSVLRAATAPLRAAAGPRRCAGPGWCPRRSG